LSISNQMVLGTNAKGNSGDIRTAETYANDQYSQVTVTSTALTGTQWIGPAVRAQSGGQNLYVGTYKWNSGSPVLMLFKRINGTCPQGAPPSAGGPPPAGTTLTLTALGNTLALSVNGTPRITVSDTSLTSGAPGIMANGAATADNWTGGTASFQVTYQS